MALEKINEINILGYSGSYLALIFETLTSQNFNGTVNIFVNEDNKRALAPFETNIRFNEIHYTQVSNPPISGFVFCSNKPETKKFLFNFYRNLWGISAQNFISINHSSSVIASTVKENSGLYVEPLSVISSYAEIGFGVTVNRNSSVGHHNTIGDFCSIHPGTNLCGNVILEDLVTIGAGSTIFPNIKIGKNTVVGGGSVVTKNLPENVLAFGNPCKVIKNL